jgi:Penicillin-insensitive murein endopeptidase
VSLFRPISLLVPVLAAAVVAAAIALAAKDGERRDRSGDSPSATAPAQDPRPPELGGDRSAAAGAAGRGRRSPARPRERIRWRRSVALGSPAAGRLVGGVRLPSEGEHFYTWDPVKRRSPNRSWRRWGTGRLVRVVLQVAREYHAAHPGAARMAVGDLSRPRGGDFGPQYGYIGHASHQNGLDVDIYYPRADGRPRAPKYASQIDRALSQELVDRFLAKGAEVIYVGPNTGLTGPAGVVQALVNHDNHLHVRIR